MLSDLRYRLRALVRRRAVEREGIEKLVGTSWVGMFAQIGLGQWFRYFTGILQAGGAVLYVIPRTALAGMAALACTMPGAVCVHLFVLHSGAGAAMIPGGLLCAIVFGWACGRSGEREGSLTLR